MITNKMRTVAEVIRRSLTFRKADVIPHHFEPMEARVLMSGVRSAPQMMLPVVSISAIDASAAESAKGNQNATFQVTRSGGDRSTDLVVNYAIAGTATNGADYQTLSGQVTIPAGKSSAVISVKPIDDSQTETAETVQLRLTASSAYTIKTVGAKTATIKDWEVAPASIQGFSFDATVKTATGSLADSSGFKLFIAADNTQLTQQDDSDSSTIPFGILSKKGNAWDTAEVKYTRISSTQATITTTELFDLGIVTGTLTFTNANTATYEFTAANGSTITGQLKKIGTGYAPSGMDSWNGKGNATSGDGSTFATHGSFFFTTASDDSYIITSGDTNARGSITGVRKLNDRVFIVDGKDNTLGHNVEAILEFTSASKATYFLTDHTGSQGSYWGYQRGTVSFATAPNHILTSNTAGGITTGLFVTGCVGTLISGSTTLSFSNLDHPTLVAGVIDTTGGSLGTSFGSTITPINTNSSGVISGCVMTDLAIQPTIDLSNFYLRVMNPATNQSVLFSYDSATGKWLSADGIDLATWNPNYTLPAFLTAR